MPELDFSQAKRGALISQIARGPAPTAQSCL